MHDSGQPLWDAGQYALFRSERARPFFDLLGRVAHERVRTIADIGCGDGGLTRSLLDRWPGAEIWGIDSSKEMLARAPSAPGLRFEQADLRSWRPPVPLDLVVSNAVLHWVPDHGDALRSFAGWLAADGVLAIQMPNNRSETAYRLAGALALEPPWRDRLRGVASGRRRRAAAVLRRAARRARLRVRSVGDDLLPSPRARLGGRRVDQGHGAAPDPTALTEDEGARFLAELNARVEPDYPEGPQGVLFPFRRLFFVAARR